MLRVEDIEREQKSREIFLVFFFFLRNKRTHTRERKNFEKSLPIKLAFVHCIVIQDCVHKYELSTHDTYSFLRGT